MQHHRYQKLLKNPKLLSEALIQYMKHLKRMYFLLGVAFLMFIGVSMYTGDFKWSGSNILGSMAFILLLIHQIQVEFNMLNLMKAIQNQEQAEKITKTEQDVDGNPLAAPQSKN